MLESPVVVPVLENIPGIRAFFTTRKGGVSVGAYRSLNLSYASGDDPDNVQQNWNRLLESQGLAGKSLVRPQLCHGAAVAEITASPSSLENTDAVFTRQTDQVLTVTMGDCLAALIADAETRCVGAVNAGWRGSRENILGLTLEKLFREGHCLPASTWIALGPCLSQEQLELSEETARTLPQAHVTEKGYRFYFDLRGCNRAQAETAGAVPNQITVLDGCTRTDAENFFSYRRDGAASGRMAACIAIV
jgi:YfiH family protein